jgi:hypothetical protein
MNTKQPSPKLTPIRPLQPRGYAINLPHPHPAPKPGQGSRELSTEEKAERYDQLVNLKAAKRATRQQIARLNRQLEKLDLEENKVLESDLAGYSTSITVPLGPCQVCNYEVCQCDVPG